MNKILILHKFKKELYLQQRIKEYETQIKTQKEQAYFIQNEVKILNSIFEQTSDNDIQSNSFMPTNHKQDIAVSNLTKEEIMRNYLAIMIGLVALSISFQRADFLTLVFISIIYSFFYKRWRNSDFLNFGIGLVILLIYDCIW